MNGSWILAALAAVMMMTGGASAHDHLAGMAAPGVAVTAASGEASGIAAVPRAKPGQTLPLRPARTIRFDTDEGTALALDLSPDGRTIVFDMLGDIYALDSKGGKARALTRGMAFDSQPVFSPDGSRILFLSDRSGAENLWTMRADGKGLRQISFFDSDPVWVSPEWSHDGTTIYVSRFWPDRNAYELWTFAVAGDGDGQVFIPNRDSPAVARDNLQNSLGASASADGRYLYYAARKGTSDANAPDVWEIARRDLQTGKVSIVIPAIGDVRLGAFQSSFFRPQVSPDGRLLTYGARRAGRTSLRVRDLHDGSDRELVELDRDQLEAAHWNDIIPRVAISPDSAAVLVNIKGGITRIDIASGAQRKIAFRAQPVLKLGPLVRSPITQETGPVRARLIQSPERSPDGRTLAFSALGSIYVMALDREAAPRRLTDTVRGYQPSWSPDGASILFVSWSGTDGGHIWSVPVEGGIAQQLTQSPAFYTDPVFTPDGGAIVALSSDYKQRQRTYMEFGLLRDAELVSLPAGGGNARVITQGKMGGKPHFTTLADTIYINFEDGVHRVAKTDGAHERVVQAVGPGWYFAEGSANADDLRISPDGKQALAQIAQQVHLFAIPEGRAPVVDLAASPCRLTDVGADFFGWADGGRTVTWSVGSTFYQQAARCDAKPKSWQAIVETPRDTPRGSLLLRGGTVITMQGDAIIADADLLVTDDRITAIGKRGTLNVPKDAAIHDVSGTYIVPGFIDTHFHLADIRRGVLDMEDWGLAVSLAYGLTTIFDPSSLSIDMLAYQDLVESGQMTGSRIYSTGPALFSFNDFRSKAEVRSVLSRYRDHYRIGNLKQYRTGNRRVRQWIAEVANALGMTPTTEGALAMKLDLSQIMDGYSGHEHVLPPATLYRDIVELLARSQTSYTLTLQITNGGPPAQDYFIARDQPHDDPKYSRFAPQFYRDQIFFQRPWRDYAAYSFPESAKSAAKVVRADGLLGMGSHGDVPGLGTHWEMQAHTMGGMTPAEVLKATTIGAAKTIGRDAELGSLEPGKFADLVILRDNPLDDIKNTLSIRQVMKNGRLYDADTLEPL